MGFVALKPLKWGDGTIEPGEPVPEGEVGRDYDTLARLGEIAEHVDIADVADVTAERDEALARAESAEASLKQALADVETLTAERDELARQVEDLTAPTPPDPPAAATEGDALPDGVTETSPGWFQLADGSKVHGRAALAQALEQPASE